MDKVTLEFRGESARDDARDAMDGQKWKAAMWDLDQELRKTTKYEVSIIGANKQASDEECDIAEELRDKIREILDGYGLRLE